MEPSFGKKLRAARKAQRLSQTDLAKAIGVGQPLVSQWEQDKAKPNADQEQKLHKLLKMVSVSSESENRDLSFGAWLSGRRGKSGLSVQELAERSGVSGPAIYNLESGRSQNPQEKTRKALEDALGVKVPPAVRQEVKTEQEIQGLGSLVDFDPHDEDDHPSCAGVYVFYDISDRPFYIGQAENISKRIKGHVEKFWFKSPIVDNGCYIEIPDKKLRYQVEQVLIKFLKRNAVINKKSVDRNEAES